MAHVSWEMYDNITGGHKGVRGTFFLWYQIASWWLKTFSKKLHPEPHLKETVKHPHLGIFVILSVGRHSNAKCRDSSAIEGHMQPKIISLE